MDTATSKDEWIKRRAGELWEHEGRALDREQACWDKAVQEYEAGTSEADRGPANPGVDVDSRGEGE